MTSFINLRRLPNGQQTEPTAHLRNLPKEPSPTQCHDNQGQCEVSSFLSLLAHRTPSGDGFIWQIPADDRAHTIGALCRCLAVCPLTIVCFGNRVCGLQRCVKVCTVSHIARRIVLEIDEDGGIPCLAIH
jgi:hypothetical protein